MIRIICNFFKLGTTGKYKKMGRHYPFFFKKTGSGAGKILIYPWRSKKQSIINQNIEKTGEKRVEQVDFFPYAPEGAY